MEEIDPSAHTSWNDLMRTHIGATVFHTAEWARVLRESYGYRARYLAESAEGRVCRLLPLMDINSVVTGRRGIGLPFSDYCSPLTTPFNESGLGHIAAPAIALGRRLDWSSLMLRCEDTVHQDVAPTHWYLGHALDLRKTEDQLLAQLRPNFRAKLRAAMKAGVEVRFESSELAMRRFYLLHCATRRRLGVPPQPWRFFERLWRYVVAADLGTICLATHGNEDLAGQVLLHFNRRAIYKYGAARRDDRKLHAPYLLMWEAIRLSRRWGCHELCLGRTDPNHSGLLQFKEGWGSTHRRLNAYRYDFRQRCFLQSNAPATDQKSNLLTRLPIPILRAVGAMVYRHVA